MVCINVLFLSLVVVLVFVVCVVIVFFLIFVKGIKFYDEDGKQFFVKGMFVVYMVIYLFY